MQHQALTDGPVSGSNFVHLQTIITNLTEWGMEHRKKIIGE
ncbi:hypothetical protein [Dyadobacter soli]|nr:hypothetical protein [Dyadobacter soli]